MAGSALRSVALAIGVLLLGSVASALPASGSPRSYAPKNGILNLRAILFGGGFRVTTAMPLHGDFSRYHHVEVTETESLVGGDVPRRVLQRITQTLWDEFRKGGRFSDVTISGAFDPEAAAAAHAKAAAVDPDAADALEAPMRPGAELAVMDAKRLARAADADDTLVISSEVIDYAKGNRWLQLLMLDLGNSVLTVRFSYFDKASGEELGSSIVSSATALGVLPSTFDPRSTVDGVASGLVDQVTRRTLGAAR